MTEYGCIHTDGSRSGGQPVLKPCPFCGSAFKMGQEPHDNFPVSGMYYIYHDYGPLGSAARECPVDVMGHFNSADEAIAAWNNRPADRIEALEAEVERLREALADLLHAVCGEKGFAEAVRRDSGRVYPWPALDLAEAKAIAALEQRK